MRISCSDLDAISEGVRELYSVTKLDLLPAAIITLLSRLIPSESISFNEFGATNGRVVSIIEPDLTNFQEKLPIFAAHIEEHPVITYFHKTQSMLPFKISDFCSRREFHGTGLYNEFYRGFEVEHQFGFFLARSPQFDVCMAINRRGRDFSERDRQVIKLLRPHLTQALSNAVEVSGLRETIGFLDQAAESCQQGAAWLDRDAKILFITRQARAWLEEFFPTPRSPSGLPDDLRRWIKAQLLALAREPLLVKKGEATLRVQLAEEGSRLLLVLARKCQTVAAGLFAAYGLTPREDEVLRWMVQGKTNPEIAKIIGARPRTIDKHVERVLAKLLVETRKAAMLKAWEIARS